MFATGPVERNKRQRQHARRQGMVLNQYGLFNEATGEVLASKTEKDIYDALGETYREPWER
jgi:DNA polymerase/3'-5' exonuclease PolX